jgi:hypothetical protein
MKKLRKYLAEFVLLFLAVFLGFIAENFRENLSDRNKERELISGMIRNLKTDTANLSIRIASNLRKDKAWDSLLHLATSELSAPSNTNQFYRNFIAGAFIPAFTPSDATIIQLKEGGSLSLINKQMVVDSILDYDYWNRVIVAHNQNYSLQHDNVWAAVYPIIQGGLLMDTTYVEFYGRGILKPMPPIIRNAQNEQAFFGIVARTLLFTRVNRSYMMNHRVRAERLILLLTREYQLEL